MSIFYFSLISWFILIFDITKFTNEFNTICINHRSNVTNAVKMVPLLTFLASYLQNNKKNERESINIVFFYPSFDLLLSIFSGKCNKLIPMFLTKINKLSAKLKNSKSSITINRLIVKSKRCYFGKDNLFLLLFFL